MVSRKRPAALFALTLTLATLFALVALAGCAGGSGEAAGGLENGDYPIEVDTDSNMFHAESCILHVADGTYTASLTLPGEGFSRLYYGTAEEAEAADDADIYDFYLNEDGKYTFDVPVAALDEELTVAAYGQRRERWYDHTITFLDPNGADAAGDEGADADDGEGADADASADEEAAASAA